MIYRLSQGAIKGWKKQLASSGLVLVLTLGFPVLAAWLNYEHHNLSTFPNGSVGAVLGESTGSDQANPDPAADSTPAGQPVAVSPPPASEPLSVGSATNSGPSASGSAGTTPSQPSAPAATSPSITVRPKEPTDDPHIINLSVPGLFELSVDP